MSSFSKPLFLSLGLAVFATGCARKEEIIEGTRLDLRQAGQTEDGITDEQAAELAQASQPITLPATQTNSIWTHRNGGTSHAITHPFLSATPTLRWARDIGTGKTARLRLSADPIIAEGRIYAMDADGQISAFSPNGGTLWSANYSAASDPKDEISGGGLAYGDGTLVATTGYGEVFAIDPATGQRKWRHKVDASVSNAPLVLNGKAVVIAGNTNSVALNLENGRIAWQRNTEQFAAGVIGTGSAAGAGKLAFVPFASGEVSATLMDTGFPIWTQVVSGSRIGNARGFVTAFSGEPVLSGDVLYLGTQSGKLAALDRKTGDRKWTITEGALGPVWPVGGSLFLVTDENKLKRLSAEDGSVIWSQDLPKFKRVKKRKGAYSHYGPVLAGGRLFVAGSDGTLRAFDPTTGGQVYATPIPGGAASHMSVSNGVLYLLSAKGQLLAFQ